MTSITLPSTRPTVTGTLAAAEVVPVAGGVACVFDLNVNGGVQTCTLTHNAWDFFTAVETGDALTVSGTFMTVRNPQTDHTTELLAVYSVDEADLTDGVQI